MTSPRYQPRTLALEPRGFGRALRLRWRDVSEVNADQLGAAHLQHLIAYEIRDQAERQCGSIREYATLSGQKYDRLAGVLRGDQIMRLEDIAIAQRHLGISTGWREDDFDR